MRNTNFVSHRLLPEASQIAVAQISMLDYIGASHERGGSTSTEAAIV